MTVLKEVVAVVGKYTDAQGAQKNRYLTIGKIIQTKQGEMLKLDSLPVGNEFTGWCYLNEPKPRDGFVPPVKQVQPLPAADSYDMEIPF